MRMTRTLLLLSLVAVATVAACTSGKGSPADDGIVTVSGIVRDWRSLAPVAGAQVRTIGILPEQTATAAGDGTFTMDGVYVNGYVILEVQATGYAVTQSPPILVEEADIVSLAVDILAQADVAAFETEFGVTGMPNRGQILGSVRQTSGAGIPGVDTVELFPVGFAFTGPFFLDASRNPDVALSATTSAGELALLNVTTGNVAIRVGGIGFDFEPAGTLVRPGVWSIVAIGGTGNGSTTPTPTPTPTGSPTPTVTPGPQSFANDIFPIFGTRGCSAVGCHQGGGNPGGGMRLDQNASNNYDDAFDRCNTGDPTSSLLLVKPLFEAVPNHQGGNIFMNNADPDYMKIHRWISDGAPNN